jgi:hypothetical protein
MRLSLAAWHLADLPETRSEVLAASAQVPQDIFTDPDGDVETMRYLSPDGRTLVSVGAGQVSYWDLATRRRTAAHPGLGNDLNSAGMVKTDTKVIPFFTGDHVGIRDLATGTRADTLMGSVNGGAEMTENGRALLAYQVSGSAYTIKLWNIARRRVQLRIAVRPRGHPPGRPGDVETP